MSEWYCLNCKKIVGTYMNFFRAFAPCCKECGESRLMKMEEMDQKKFEKLAEDFKKRTGEVE